MWKTLVARWTCLRSGHVLRFVRYTTAGERRRRPDAVLILRCERCERRIHASAEMLKPGWQEPGR